MLQIDDAGMHCMAQQEKLHGRKKKEKKQNWV